MEYHIDTGLILDKMKQDCECPLCEIEKIVEEQFLHEFLNDAVMEDNTRIKVNNLGFCDRHFQMLFARPNKLSVALQISTRADTLKKTVFKPISNLSQAKKQAKEIEKAGSTCILCDLTEESMVKYYKTIAQMFNREKDFFKLLIASKGFCFKHYAKLLQYSAYAGFTAKEYVKILSSVQTKNFERIKNDLNAFCLKHDYRNANIPLGDAETALKRMGEKFYGKKD